MPFPTNVFITVDDFTEIFSQGLAKRGTVELQFKQFGFFVFSGYQYHILLIFPAEVNGYNGQRYLHVFVYICHDV